MNSFYQKICREYQSGDELMKAIVLNKASVYYYLTEVIMLGSSSYRNIGSKSGTTLADSLLTETLLAFRRQIKFSKIELNIQNGKVLVSSDKQPLQEYLSDLYLLVSETSPANPSHPRMLEFEQKLINGQGFYRVNSLKESILRALYTFGCRDEQDREEIYNESLLIFWKKLSSREVGIYFSGEFSKPENLRVFNRRFYQNSKLGTYLSGIARNIFLNRTRSPEFQVSKNKTAELNEQDSPVTAENEDDTPAVFLFLYYRNQVEDRKLRSLVSLLQYDCNLEDKEVCLLMGINNARIHSSRLRARFAEWYRLNIRKIPELLDDAHDYLAQRETKKELLNLKIRTVECYRLDSLKYIDLKVFKEEFRTVPEFRQYYKIFRYLFYLSGVGKPSALSGLPDEKSMRILLETYKEELYNLPSFQAILILLFYGSDEPAESLIRLMKSLEQESVQQDSDPGNAPDLIRQIRESAPEDEASLTNELYSTNTTLFRQISAEKNFINIISGNEQA